eukprot:14510170-Ditylum_brightwellii.AAC.1
MEYYKIEEDNLFVVPNQVHKLISDLYSYLSDDNVQDAATTTSHLDIMLVELIRREMVSQKVSTIWEETDGLNAVDKAYLNNMVFRMYNPGSKHTAKDTVAHSCAPSKKIRYASEFRDLL